MEIVYFNDSLVARAPALMGSLYIKGSDKWASGADIEAALSKGAAVVIRPATPEENDLAEQLVSLYEIGEELALRRQMLFAHLSDHYPAVVAEMGGM